MGGQSQGHARGRSLDRLQPRLLACRAHRSLPLNPKHHEIAQSEEKLEQVEQEALNEAEEEDEELSWSSESEIGDALDWLDSEDDTEDMDGAFALNSRRPNAHGGLHYRCNSSTLQPLSNRNQKFSNHIRASPLEEWEGRMNVGMSNYVTTAIRESVREMAIGKTKVTEKADRATVEQVDNVKILYAAY